MTCESSRSLRTRVINLGKLAEEQVPYKLSLGPNMFVGMAEVKSHPYWSWYALPFFFETVGQVH